jgi:eukaryotic-like serine/threonine-protein kinase
MIAHALTGRTLGNYRVLEKVGQGGMGAVYLGEHRIIGRRVAIKVLLPEVASDQSRLKRFFNEARASAQVRHPSIVDVLDFGTHDDTSYLVMEYLEGESVRSRLKRSGALPEVTVRRFGRQVASALAAAHARGIIHRDLKPDNLFLVPDEDVIGKERIKVLDFGIAKLLADSGEGAVDTGSGAILGSPGYMAPEQAGGHGPVDERADVYALGCVLFEMLCARRPFAAAGLAGVLSMQMFSPTPTPRLYAPDVSEELEAIVMRMLARHPSDRFASMDEVVAAIDDSVDAAAIEVAQARIITPGLDSVEGTTTLGPAEPPRAAVLDAGLVGATQTADTGSGSESRRRSHAAIAIAALVAIGAAVAVLSRSTDDGAPTPPASAPTSVPAGSAGEPPPPVSAPVSPPVASPPAAAPAGAEEPEGRDAVASKPDAGPAAEEAAPTRRPPRRAPRKVRPKLERGQVIDD